MENKKTLEDALADMEAAKERDLDYRTEFATEIEAESTKRRAFSARMDGLTQAERRKVLDAAGMRHISAALPPIRPIKYSYVPPRAVPVSEPLLPTAISSEARNHWWNLNREISRLKGEIAELERMNHQGMPSEAIRQKHEIKALRTDLAELEKRWEIPFSDTAPLALASETTTLERSPMEFLFPDLPSIGLWDWACFLTAQNAADNIPNNATRYKIRQLIGAIAEHKLWVDFKPNADFIYVVGLIPEILEDLPNEVDWRNIKSKLQKISIRREDWETFSALALSSATVPMVSTPQLAPASKPAPSPVINSLIKIPKQSPRDHRPWETLNPFFGVIPGLYMCDQVVWEIADAESWSDDQFQDLLEKMVKAINNYSLPIHCRKTGLTISVDEPDSYCFFLVTPDDVNAWLEKRGAPYRWKLAAPAVEVPISQPQAAAASEPVTLATVLSIAPAAVADSPTERRAKIDISRERGARRRIIENWTSIEMSHGQGADGHQVLRFLKMDKGEKEPKLKTVQNILSILRKEKLIP